MAVKVEFVEGWTGPLDFQLLNDGAAQNLSGLTITGQAINRLRQTVDLSSDVSQLSATGGTVRMRPDTGDFPAADSPYELRFKCVDAATDTVFFPSGEAIYLIVRP